MLLRSIWELSWVLAAASLALMTVLIVARLGGRSRTRRVEDRRAAVLSAVLSWLQGGVPDEEVRRLLARDGDLSTGLLIEVFEVVRGEDLARLAKLAEDAGIAQRLRDKLRGGYRRERLNAAETLVWFGSDESCEALGRAVADRDDDVGFAAAATLSDLGRELGPDSAFAARLDRSATSLRLELVLNRVARCQPDDLMQLASDENRTDRVRVAAIGALTRAGALEHFEALSALAASPSAKIRAAIARSLGRFGNPAGQDTIARLLQDEDGDVRADAAEAAGRIGSPLLGDDLCALLDDPNWWVRHRAGEALAKLGEAGIGALRELAARGADAASQTASQVLAGRRRSAA